MRSMLRTMLQSKIHRAVVTDSDLNYEGSITIDEELLEAAGMYEYQLVQVVDINNGSRFETYIIKGERGSGTMCINGAAARLVHRGDLVIVFSYVQCDESEIERLEQRIVLVDEKNRIKK